MPTIELAPSKSDFEMAARLGRRMYREDTWIRPSIEANDLKESGDDYGQFTLLHRDEWGETNQFQMIWLEHLCALSEAAARCKGVDRNADWSGWFYSFHEPLKEALWEAWEEKAKLYEAWQAARQRNGKEPA